MKAFALRQNESTGLNHSPEHPQLFPRKAALAAGFLGLPGLAGELATRLRCGLLLNPVCFGGGVENVEDGAVESFFFIGMLKRESEPSTRRSTVNPNIRLVLVAFFLLAMLLGTVLVVHRQYGFRQAAEEQVRRSVLGDEADLSEEEQGELMDYLLEDMKSRDSESWDLDDRPSD